MTPSERACAEIRARILDLRFRPGQVVPDLALAAELGVDRATIHTALARLQAEGLVDALPRRGFIVASPTADTMRQIYEIVGALEGQCVRRAARDGGAILLAALRAAIEAQESALARDDVDGWVDADRRFHDLLREGSANRRLRDLIQQFGGQLRQVGALTIHLRDRPHHSTDDHRAILTAIESGDEDEAIRVHHAHRRRADAEMLAALDEYVRLSTGRPSKRADGTISVEAGTTEHEADARQTTDSHAAPATLATWQHGRR
jgi:DNA-binding GntR family transcriptional regulator